MNAQSKIDMIKALRLTREGRLVEAMAVLRGARAGAASFDANSEPKQGSAGAGAHAPDRLVDGSLPRITEALKGVLGRMGQLRPAGLFGGSGVARARPTIPPGARFEERGYANEAGSRAYKLYVPSGYDGQALPLVVMLHGCTQSPDDFAAGTRMNDLAEERTFLAAYPAQARSANVSKCWNWFSTGDQQRDRGEPSLIAGITRQIMRDFSVDSGRIFIAGLSAGGAVAAIMGSTYPDLYAGIGVHSGLACGAARDMASAVAAMRDGGPTPAGKSPRNGGSEGAVPTIVFHGDRDTIVNPVNGDQVIAQSKAAGQFRVSVDHGEAQGGIRYTRTVQADESGRSMLEHWVVHGGGHAWFGGNAAGSYTEPRGPDASREMMRFFLDQPAKAATFRTL
ncbi:MAG TPA: PHB depolymerase family esterase [Stellaceae bacterium]|nr:PHB depolymerase family esterase [Stellaceae bacterium]